MGQAAPPPGMGSPMMPGPMGPPPGAAPPVGLPPPPSPFTDLSVSLPPEWQLVDVSARNLQSALNTGAFYNDPPTQAALKHIHGEMLRLISAFSGSGRPTSVETSAPRGAPGTATADAQPEPVSISDSAESEQ